MSEYLVKVFSKGIGPEKIFAMADSKKEDQVKLSILL